MAEHILVADDEPALINALRYAFEREGYRVHAVLDGPSALAVARRDHIDLAVIDVVLPGMSGPEVCRALREIDGLPIIILSARTDEEDVVAGLEAGADAYVRKPFSPSELVGRVHALLRRRRLDASEGEPARIVRGALELDLLARELRVDGRPVALTVSEFEILRLLASSPGQVFSRRDIMTHLWRAPFFGDERTADAHVSKLRAKIEPDPAHPSVVVTVRSVGYKLAI
jgi:DNA-binding response OmpR family regulator